MWPPVPCPAPHLPCFPVHPGWGDPQLQETGAGFAALVEQILAEARSAQAAPSPPLSGEQWVCWQPLCGAQLGLPSHGLEDPSPSFPARPLWLSPLQVMVIPVGPDVESYACEVSPQQQLQPQPQSSPLPPPSPLIPPLSACPLPGPQHPPPDGIHG